MEITDKIIDSLESLIHDIKIGVIKPTNLCVYMHATHKDKPGCGVMYFYNGCYQDAVKTTIHGLSQLTGPLHGPLEINHAENE